MKILRVIITLTRGRYCLGQYRLKLRNPWFNKVHIDISKIKRCKISMKFKKKKRNIKPSLDTTQPRT